MPETTCSKLYDVLNSDPNVQKGEMVIILAPYREKEINDVPDEAVKMMNLLKGELSPKKVCEIVAKIYGLRKNQLYKFFLEQIHEGASEEYVDDE